MLRTCAHPNVVTCYGASPDGGELYIERGARDLYDVLAEMKDNCLPTEEVLRVAKETCAGLQHVHEKGCGPTPLCCPSPHPS